MKNKNQETKDQSKHIIMKNGDHGKYIISIVNMQEGMKESTCCFLFRNKLPSVKYNTDVQMLHI